MAENNSNVKLQVLLENHRALTCRYFDEWGTAACRRGNEVRNTDCGGEISCCDEENKK